MNHQEKERITEHSRIACYAAGVMEKATSYCCDVFRRNMRPGNVLELGPAEGIMTDLLFPYYKDYTVVDGADFFVKDIIDKHPGIEGHCALFEEFNPTKTYNNIILGHVLEHVEKPVDILRMCATWLSPDGVILAAVPNSHSIHRQAAVLMGLLEKENELNDTDRRNGHRRVYNMPSLQKDFLDAGLKIVKSGGYWLKPEHNAFIDNNWNDKMIDAFLQLGESYPEIAGEIYIIAQK